MPSASEALKIQRDIVCGERSFQEAQAAFLEEHKAAHAIVYHEPTGVAIKAVYLNPLWTEICDRAMFWTLVADAHKRSHPLAYDHDYEPPRPKAAQGEER